MVSSSSMEPPVSEPPLLVLLPLVSQAQREAAPTQSQRTTRSRWFFSLTFILRIHCLRPAQHILLCQPVFICVLFEEGVGSGQKTLHAIASLTRQLIHIFARPQPVAA